MNSFQKGFEKTAGIGTLLGALALTPVQKRLGEHVFELSKRNAMGIDPAKSAINSFSKGISNRINKDLDFVENLPNGLRKKFNNYMMYETPLVANFYPAHNGRLAGKNLATIAEKIPGNKEKYKSVLADLTSPIESDNMQGHQNLQELKKKILMPLALISTGVIGSSGLAGYALSNAHNRRRERENMSPSLTPQPSHHSDYSAS
jgi:hypothetical protein